VAARAAVSPATLKVSDDARRSGTDTAAAPVPFSP
jgi:hypothetical protein